jgi:hypothetical protein
VNSLGWTHAEYIKLVRSLTDQDTWDVYKLVPDRYVPAAFDGFVEHAIRVRTQFSLIC